MHGLGDERFFRLVAPIYDLVMPRAPTEPLVAGLDEATGDLDIIIDLGGGTGRASLALPDQSPIVIDVTTAMLSRARERGLEGVLGTAGRLPIPDGAVDAVIVVDAFHHFPDQDAALRELFRIVRPGGVVVIREFDPAHPLGWLVATGERVIRMDSTFSTPDALASRLGAVGFDASVQDRGFGYTVTGVVPLPDSG